MHVSRTTFRKILVSTIFIELVTCLGLGIYFTLDRPGPRSSPALNTVSTASAYEQATFTQKTVNAGIPVRLKIPKINVDAPLDQVGLTPQGDMDSPKDPTHAGWYVAGPRPGDSGDAVINGHFGYKNKLAAVFDNLHKLQAGDSVFVEDDKGITTTFLVRESRTFQPNDDATVVFRPNDGDKHLNLITCQGAWDKAQKSYTTRLVIFTDKADGP